MHYDLYENVERTIVIMGRSLSVNVHTICLCLFAKFLFGKLIESSCSRCLFGVFKALVTPVNEKKKSNLYMLDAPVYNNEKCQTKSPFCACPENTFLARS